MKKRKRSKEWIFFIGVAVLVHLALFIYIKPSFFTAFKRSPLEDAATAPRGTGMPDAIVYIPIEIDETVERTPVEQLSDESPLEETIEKTDRPQTPTSGAPSQFDIAIDSLLGEATHTLPQGPGAQLVVIPPRPLEITWPDTRKLKHCLGHQINVRIQVSEEGEILRVDVEDDAHPSDCVMAALDSARRIVFAPGKINGEPVKMWTQIRIDFKRKD
ncbi:MAG: energy transducer TonB [Candidatus Latescibacterota bacterium]|nr:MAG: energy transducer TonB [Candidatus Latescibacterota bacterium]